ncbi:MAG: phosphoenolpyruvate--protein phosphotransferase [Gammaproteobacteria bacterium]|nr:phosphoenolpyruvate--protein phosphotransferase [Gammaproteobacteria bacterium]
MLILHGAGVGKGIAIGPAFMLSGGTLNVPEYFIDERDQKQEVERFNLAIADARRQLETIAANIPADAPSESASFIEAYLLMLQDPLIAEHPVETIRARNLNAERALQIHSAALVDAFDAMEDDYLRSKRTDVEHVVNRIQSNLLNVRHETLGHVTNDLTGRIIIAHDLSPADAVLLKAHRVAAFAIDLGGPISHTAILARSLNIPAVVGLHGATRYITHDETVVVDGKRGVLMAGADAAALEAFEERRRYADARQQELQSLVSRPAVTRDGVAVSLQANIELPEDIDSAVKANPEGVGLYRTEYLFMNRARPPQESEQYTAYCRVMKQISNSVTIRTLDLGADKQVDGGRREDPTNPALGLRAVRLCLKEPALFKPQLRAILRASAHGPAQLMIPMVSNLDELTQVMDLIDEVKNELRREGRQFNENLPIGGMIEVPAAAVAADLFASRLDFLSIGTNDLIQYTLAIDRVDDEVNYLYDPLHPAVLRLIKTTIDAGRRAGIPVTMCGEMAGNPRFTKLLLAMGLRIFSMDPTTLLEVKKKVLSADIAETESWVEEILSCGDTQALRGLVTALDG